MKKNILFKDKVDSFLFDHYILKKVLHETKGVFISLLAAFIFAFGFSCFITPSYLSEPAVSADQSIVSNFVITTGGVSGLSQNLATFINLIFGFQIPHSAIVAIGYVCFNIPLMILAFFGIGKRFTFLTAINVIASGVLLLFLPDMQFIKDIASSGVVLDSIFARVIFGAVCTGVSSAIAFKGDISCGGIDIITYYVSLRKSTSVGKYTIAFNSLIISIGSILVIIENSSTWSNGFISLFYSGTYLLLASLIIDLINLRNKKIQLTFITKKEKFATILMSHFPHGATIVNSKGAFSNMDSHIVYMVVSSYEMKKVVEVAKKVDPNVFCTATSLVQVFGNFFIKPVD